MGTLFHIRCAGGLLEIWSPNATAAELEAGPLVRIQPEVNTLVRFRGDATHQVLKHFSKSGQVSLWQVHWYVL